MEETKGDVTLVCINEKSQRFVFDSEDSFDEDEIEEFISKFSNGQLKPNYKSEIEPTNNAKKLIKTFVGSSFESILEANEAKNMVIYFYSKRYCEKCAEFELLYTDLAKRYVKNKDIIFGKLNVDNNEFPVVFSIKSVPALFIRRAFATEPNLFDYKDNSNLNDLISFIEGTEKTSTEEL